MVCKWSNESCLSIMFVSFCRSLYSLKVFTSTTML